MSHGSPTQQSRHRSLRSDAAWWLQDSGRHEQKPGGTELGQWRSAEPTGHRAVSKVTGYVRSAELAAAETNVDEVADPAGGSRVSVLGGSQLFERCFQSDFTRRPQFVESETGSVQSADVPAVGALRGRTSQRTVFVSEQ